MKINKNKVILNEDIETVNSNTESEPVDQVDDKEELTEKKIELDLPDDFDIDDASRGDLVRAIRASIEQGKEAGDPAAAKAEQLPDEAIKKHAEDVYKAADLIENPYGASTTSALVDKLQAALETALTDKKNGVDQDYPNVLLYGLAGFGKTAIVKQFCKDHHLNLFTCDAKSLDPATIGGIPYPVKDKNGKLTQRPVVSSYWDKLFADNTVLFLDEFNRAPANIQGSLLTLINEHILPMTIETEEGTANEWKFNNILFTVCAVNPASAVFSDASELTPEKVSRFSAIHEIETTPDVLKDHLVQLYDGLLSNPLLDQDTRDKWEGQKAIAVKLLSDPAFIFDGTDEVMEIHIDNNRTGVIHNFLNYRTFVANLKQCNGTKADYLKKLSNPNFTKRVTTMIKNILATYTDAPKKGNSVFTKAQQQAAAAATTAQKAKVSKMGQGIFDSFAASLDDVDI